VSRSPYYRWQQFDNIIETKFVISSNWVFYLFTNVCTCVFYAYFRAALCHSLSLTTCWAGFSANPCLSTPFSRRTASDMWRGESEIMFYDGAVLGRMWNLGHIHRKQAFHWCCRLRWLPASVGWIHRWLSTAIEWFNMEWRPSCPNRLSTIIDSRDVQFFCIAVVVAQLCLGNVHVVGSVWFMICQWWLWAVTWIAILHNMCV